MSPFLFALSIVLFSILFFLTSSFFQKARIFQTTVGLLFLILGLYSLYDFWLPIIRNAEQEPAYRQINRKKEPSIPGLQQSVKSNDPVLRTIIALESDSPLEIIQKMGCASCHQIPGFEWKDGLMGPILIEKILAPKRIASPEYLARVKNSKAHAQTPREYVMESIISPDNFIVPAFINSSNPERSIMYHEYDKKFTYGALEKLVDFLLTLDCDSARREMLNGPSSETVVKICG